MDSENSDHESPNNPLQIINSLLPNENPKEKEDDSSEKIAEDDFISVSANTSLLPKEVNNLFDRPSDSNKNEEENQNIEDNHESEKTSNFNDTIPCDFDSFDNEAKDQTKDSINNDNQESNEKDNNSDFQDDFIDGAETNEKNEIRSGDSSSQITTDTLEVSSKLIINSIEKVQTEKTDNEHKNLQNDGKTSIDHDKSIISQDPWPNEVHGQNLDLINEFLDNSTPAKQDESSATNVGDSSMLQTEEINFGFDENDSQEPIPQPSQNTVDLQSTLLTSSTTLDSDKDDVSHTTNNESLTPIKLNLNKLGDREPYRNTMKKSSRSTNMYSSKPEPFRVPPFDQQQFNLATQRSSRLTPEMQQFKQMILGEPSSRPRTSALKQRSKTVVASSPYTRDEIISMANNLAAGKSAKIDDPGTVADVIDELTNIRLESMEKKDYVQTTKIGSVITNLRHSYRQQDRYAYYKEKVDDLMVRMSKAQDSLQQQKETWKEKEKEEIQQYENELREMDENHAQQLQKLEDDWKDDKNQRRFNRRSPFLLNQLQIEKNMLLTGDYIDAQHIRSVNQRFEKQEAQQKYTNMVWDYEEARKKLLNGQKQEIRNLKQSQDLRHKLFQRKMNQDLDLTKKTISNLQFKLNEEGNYNNFCALKFKKSSDVVLPMTVTMEGGNDIPTAGKVRLTCGDNGEMQRFRQLNSFPPLQLPTLQASKIKHRPKAIITKKKK